MTNETPQDDTIEPAAEPTPDLAPMPDVAPEAPAPAPVLDEYPALAAILADPHALAPIEALEQLAAALRAALATADVAALQPRDGEDSPLVRAAERALGRHRLGVRALVERIASA